jgi:hypothetical protein
MMSAPEPIRRARFARPLLQLSLLVLFSLALFWGVELLRRQDPFLRAVANLPPELQQLELLLERPTLTLRDGARTLATLHFDALAIERNRIHWRAKHLRQAILYDARGKPIGTARADELTYNFPAKRLYIAGNPTLTIHRHPLGEFPLTVQTAWLNWDLRYQQIHTDLPTRLTWQDGQGTIERLRWDLASGVLELERGAFRVSSALIQERAQPKREIDIQWDTAKLRGDHSEVRGLRLRDGDTFATAERADIYDRKRYALATGALRLEDPRIDIDGKQLEIWYGENQNARACKTVYACASSPVRASRHQKAKRRANLNKPSATPSMRPVTTSSISTDARSPTCAATSKPCSNSPKNARAPSTPTKPSMTKTKRRSS